MASYEAANYFGDLALTKARGIASESDCVALGIDQGSAECAAYYILNRLLKIHDSTN